MKCPPLVDRCDRRFMPQLHTGSVRRDRKEEAVAEVIAIAWRAYSQLANQGRDVAPLLGKIVLFAARRVRSGGRLVGMNRVRDVMSPTARFRHGHTINSLPLSEAEDTAREVRPLLKRSRI